MSDSESESYSDDFASSASEQLEKDGQLKIIVLTTYKEYTFWVRREDTIQVLRKFLEEKIGKTQHTLMYNDRTLKDDLQTIGDANLQCRTVLHLEPPGFTFPKDGKQIAGKLLCLLSAVVMCTSGALSNPAAARILKFLRRCCARKKLEALAVRQFTAHCSFIHNLYDMTLSAPESRPLPATSSLEHVYSVPMLYSLYSNCLQGILPSSVELSNCLSLFCHEFLDASTRCEKINVTTTDVKICVISDCRSVMTIRSLLSGGLSSSDVSYCFLGGFSGGGGLESLCVTISLLLLKLIAPTHVKLVRGLPEDSGRDLSLVASERFGSRTASLLSWCLRRLPLCASITFSQTQPLLLSYSGVPSEVAAAGFMSSPGVDIERHRMDFLSAVPDERRTLSTYQRAANQKEVRTFVGEDYCKQNGLSGLIRSSFNGYQLKCLDSRLYSKVVTCCDNSYLIIENNPLMTVSKVCLKQAVPLSLADLRPCVPQLISTFPIPLDSVTYFRGDVSAYYQRQLQDLTSNPQATLPWMTVYRDLVQDTAPYQPARLSYTGLRYLSRLELDWVLKWGTSIDFMSCPTLAALMDENDESLNCEIPAIAKACFAVFVRNLKHKKDPVRKATTIQLLTVLLFFMRNRERGLFDGFVNPFGDSETTRREILEKSDTVRQIFSKENKDSRSLSRKINLLLQLMHLQSHEEILSLVDNFAIALGAPFHAWELFNDYRVIRVGVASSLGHTTEVADGEVHINAFDYMKVTTELLPSGNDYQAARLWGLFAQGDTCSSNTFAKTFDIYDTSLGEWLSQAVNSFSRVSSPSNRPEWTALHLQSIGRSTIAAVIVILISSSTDISLRVVIKRKERSEEKSRRVMQISNCKSTILRLGSLVLRRVFSDKKVPMPGVVAVSMHHDDDQNVKSPPRRDEDVILRAKCYFNSGSAPGHFLLKGDSCDRPRAAIHVSPSPTLAASLLQLWFFFENAKVPHNIGLQFCSPNGSSIHTNAPTNAIPITQLRDCLSKSRELLLYKYGIISKVKESIQSVEDLYHFLSSSSRLSQSLIARLKCLFGSDKDCAPVDLFYDLINFLTPPPVSKAPKKEVPEEPPVTETEDDIGLKMDLIRPSVHGYAYACGADNISLLHSAVADAVDRAALNSTKFQGSQTRRAISVGAICATDEASEGLCQVIRISGTSATVHFMSNSETQDASGKKKLVNVATSRLRNQNPSLRLSIINELGFIVYQRSNLGLQRSNGRLIVGHGSKACPLHYALVSMQHASIEYLLKEGADPRHQSVDGTTPKSLCLFNAKSSFRRSKEAAAEASTLKSSLTSLKGKEGSAAKVEFTLQNEAEDCQKELSKSPTNAALRQKTTEAEKKHREKKAEADKLKAEVDKAQNTLDALLRAVEFGKIAGTRYRKWAEVLEPKPKTKQRPPPVTTTTEEQKDPEKEKQPDKEEQPPETKKDDSANKEGQESPAPSPRTRQEQQEKEQYLKQLCIEEEEKTAKEKYLASQS